MVLDQTDDISFMVGHPCERMTVPQVELVFAAFIGCGHNLTLPGTLVSALFEGVPHSLIGRLGIFVTNFCQSQ